MLNSYYFVIPFVLQVLWIAVDEFYCHHQRKLPRWERIGHPLDTITVLACLFWVLYVPITATSVRVFIGLSIFSSLFVLKDDEVHFKECGVFERWLHTLVLTLHPVVLLCAGLLWPALQGTTGHFYDLIQYHGFEHSFLVFETAMIVLFLFYQTIYWNFIYQPVNRVTRPTLKPVPASSVIQEQPGQAHPLPVFELAYSEKEQMS
ncbi:MAG: hypothetical protein HYR56_33965 [Acidobacteria bacterium]|nr:hypothetical protein [Acidobacteriota bacterium]MBI3427753.1 hypothetical protein [Acidobacteriota bacterium]